MKKTKSFEFKQFKITGGLSGMPVSTDGVLLGAWANLSQVDFLLDIGTGTGLLALMCAQRKPTLTIDAIDIDQNACDAAISNFSNSPWQERLTLHQGDILSAEFSHCFDAIICNPPYFNSGEKAQDTSRAIARHTDTLNHSSLLTRCWERLTTQGKASFVLPATEGEAFITLAIDQGWHVQRLCRIKTTEMKAVSRLLIQIGKEPIGCETSELTIRTADGYSDAFIQLTKAFYLKM
ncbi:tRNA1(Val) (adenine(37)-N6)-methyltransferase [Vibrio sinaloensis]|uniref:tRNA1(Val) (adenine(37)-N6)-methyltransferase n=1 Tax=Photobacterium sp. (strain ATCC 43367) TaxID=379097 RepID=A0A0A5HXK0_PHOS4|nr:methyltransferase [Vibrio sinaloensis]KGY08224.1 SAM-dependent methlyltransferase [Vibrio sinaloensis]